MFRICSVKKPPMSSQASNLIPEIPNTIRKSGKEKESTTHNDRQLIRLINQKLFLFFSLVFLLYRFCTAVAISTHNITASQCQTYIDKMYTCVRARALAHKRMFLFSCAVVVVVIDCCYY